jgi:hypothetical protein
MQQGVLAPHWYDPSVPVTVWVQDVEAQLYEAAEAAIVAAAAAAAAVGVSARLACQLLLHGSHSRC